MSKFNPSEQKLPVSYIRIMFNHKFRLKQTPDVFQNKFTNDKIMVKSLREMQARNLKQYSRMAAIPVNVMYTKYTIFYYTHKCKRSLKLNR